METILEYNDAIVESIDICRRPIRSYQDEFLRGLIMVPHHILYHCSIIFNTNKGKLFLNKGTSIEMSTTIPPIHESIHVTDVPHATIKTYIENAKQCIGDKFLIYDFVESNCQDFVDGVLKGNQISYDESFVKQDKSFFIKEQWIVDIGKKIIQIKKYVDLLLKGSVFTILTFVFIIVIYFIVKELRCISEMITKRIKISTCFCIHFKLI